MPLELCELLHPSWIPLGPLFGPGACERARMLRGLPRIQGKRTFTHCENTGSTLLCAGMRP